MTPSKNYSRKEGQQLEAVVHDLTKHVERINSHVSADDDSAAWHELKLLKAFLNRAIEWPPTA